MNARRARGFSLLEVIVAILLLAVAFAALMRVAGGAAGLTRRAAAHDEAAMWARSLLDSAFVLDAPVPGVTEGRFDDGYRWRLQVSPWTPPGAAPDGALRLYRLDLDVSWGASSHPDHARFSTLRAVSATPGSPPA
ncbi:prepilin-type N-terminal cleavage/methylation domain-containing protein [Fulvimonas sp. R45]|jgi:general secretion pathway protein I|uniref:prepilin-type N-terminal cleavage/methylation domain-containing protein n=1 Tax=Fulvimonas sp. R45 TaxID=3045937 RepID=UPI00265FD166|nr:prepilin-type N-terminal cleavage/methylation domain-containing protein [Fulvimonas sp. R45]MDO1528945.1 prepilin-type N-terminal cleavage/methylation domain-containing protein [Fulvimonas sp. R45]